MHASLTPFRKFLLSPVGSLSLKYDFAEFHLTVKVFHFSATNNCIPAEGFIGRTKVQLTTRNQLLLFSPN